MITWIQIFGSKHPKKLQGQKTCKIRCNFGHLQILTANISGMDQDIKNRNSKWSTSIILELSKQLVNFVALTQKFSNK